MSRTTTTERNGVLLVTEHGDMQAWLPLGVEDEWREISWRQGNYPALRVSEINATKKELGKFIQQNYVGWIVRKMNLPGVAFDADAIITEPVTT